VDFITQGLSRLALQGQTLQALHKCLSENKKLWKTTTVGAICSFIAEEQLKKIVDKSTFNVATSIIKEFLDNVVWTALHLIFRIF